MGVFTPKELAERWRCSTDTVYRLAKSGKLKTFRVGADVRILEDEVIRYENNE